jgi:spermidine synthase
VLGSLLGGFFLLPWLGMQGSTAVALAATMLAACSLALATGPVRRDRVFAGACALALAAGLVAWLRLPPSALVDQTLKWWHSDDYRIVTVREGVNETIAVVEEPLGSFLVTNGFSMAGTSFADQRYMRAFVHVPALLADRIERVMVMCFGVGGTASAALAHPEIQRVDVVDLSRDILEHADYFASPNGQVLSDPRVRVHVNDARLHLRMSSEPTYDLITGEPPPLPHAGVVNLYTREFFELAKSRLRPGGIVTYWLPAFQIGEHVTRSVVRAFLDVFPDAFLLDGYKHQLMLIGRKDAPLTLEPRRLRERLGAASPAVANDLRFIALDQLVEWVGLLAATPDTLALATEGVEALTDDHPALEYGARVLVRDRRLPANLFSVDDFERWCPGCDALSDAERDEIASYLEVKRAWYRSPSFLALQPGGSIQFRGRLSLAARQAIARSVYLQDLLGLLPYAHAQALADAWHGRPKDAVGRLEPLVAQRPNQLRLQLELAWMLELAGRPEEAAKRIAQLRRQQPQSPIWRDRDDGRTGASGP